MSALRFTVRLLLMAFICLACLVEIRRMAIACLRVLEREAPALFADFEIYRADDNHDAARVAYHKV